MELLGRVEQGGRKDNGRRIDKEKIKITLKQKEMNTDNLARLVNMRESGNAKDHSLSDFIVIISCCLLPELGVKIGIDKNVVEFAFRGSS